MKKLITYLFTIILVLSLFSGISSKTFVYADETTPTLPKGPNVFAQTAVLIDASSGAILYDKKCHKKMYPASITKIMTALLTIENSDLDDTITFTKSSLDGVVYGIDANIGCKVGEKMKVKDALYALMLSSANEVAAALGEHVAGSRDKFADMMNKRAKEAGATDTHFVNANGLYDENHYVTAYDMAMITRAAASYDTFNQIVNSTSYTIPKNNKRKTAFQSYQRHKMVWPTSGFYYKGIIGGKTGYTDEAGTTLVTYAKRNGMTLISVVLHSNGTEVYKDTKSLLDYGFDNYELLNISDYVNSFSDSDNSLNSPFSDTLTSINIDSDATVIVPKGTSFDQLSSKVSFKKTDDSFATISYSLGDMFVGSAAVKYAEKTVAASLDTTSISTDTNEETETTTTPPKKSFKFPKFVLPLLAVVVIIIIILMFIIRKKRKMNYIRSQKRNRNREN